MASATGSRRLNPPLAGERPRNFKQNRHFDDSGKTTQGSRPEKLLDPFGGQSADVGDEIFSSLQVD
jgi:hypothetical protein